MSCSLCQCCQHNYIIVCSAGSSHELTTDNDICSYVGFVWDLIAQWEDKNMAEQGAAIVQDRQFKDTRHGLATLQQIRLPNLLSFYFCFCCGFWDLLHVVNITQTNPGNTSFLQESVTHVCRELLDSGEMKSTKRSFVSHVATDNRPTLFTIVSIPITLNNVRP